MEFTIWLVLLYVALLFALLRVFSSSRCESEEEHPANDWKGSAGISTSIGYQEHNVKGKFGV